MTKHAVKFVPHECTTHVHYAPGARQHDFDMPAIHIWKDALREMELIVELGEVEVGWMGIATRTGNVITIQRVYLVEQEVHGSTTDMTTAGQLDLIQRVEADGFDAEEIKLWGHSHVHYEPDPSDQDNAQLEQFGHNGADWFLRGILNKDGKVKFTLRDFRLGLIFIDVSWVMVEGEELTRLRLERQMKQYVHGFGTFGSGERNYTRLGEVPTGIVPARAPQTEGEVRAQHQVYQETPHPPALPASEAAKPPDANAPPPASSAAAELAASLAPTSLVWWKRWWNFWFRWIYKIQPGKAEERLKRQGRTQDGSGTVS